MHGKKVFLLYLTIYFIMTPCATARINDRKVETRTKESSLEILPNLKLQLQGRSLSLNWSLKSLLPDGEITSRHGEDGGGGGGKKKIRKGLKRIRTLLMMIPFGMQMMSLPGAISSIKTQLIRSIFVGKMALLMIIYNAIRNSLMKEVVVVHKIPPQHHEHFYPPELDDDTTSGSWWGR